MRVCGIFAYAGSELPTRDTLTEAVRLASRRGPHGHGWATADGVHRRLGELSSPRDVPAARWVLGHSRLATYGMPRDESGLQPVTVDGHTLIHNGNVRNWHELAQGYDLPDGPTDSWVLGHLYAHFRQAWRPPREALSRALSQCDTKAGAIVVRDSSGSLVAWRRRLPIHALHTRTGVYLSSGSMPGSHLLPEDRALIIKEAT